MLSRRNVGKFLKPEGNFLKNLSMFRLQIRTFELILTQKKSQYILGYDTICGRFNKLK